MLTLSTLALATALDAQAAELPETLEVDQAHTIELSTAPAPDYGLTALSYAKPRPLASALGAVGGSLAGLALGAGVYALDEDAGAAALVVLPSLGAGLGVYATNGYGAGWALTGAALGTAVGLPVGLAGLALGAVAYGWSDTTAGAAMMGMGAGILVLAAPVGAWVAGMSQGQLAERRVRVSPTLLSDGTQRAPGAALSLRW